MTSEPYGREVIVALQPTPGQRPVAPRSAATSRLPAPMMNRVRSEFREMPGLALTLAQASRLFGLSEAECLGVFTELLGRDLLYLRSDGRFAARATGT